MEIFLIGAATVIFIFFAVIWNIDGFLNVAIKTTMTIMAIGYVLMFLQKSGIVTGINLI